jgi:hypothetical protein
MSVKLLLPCFSGTFSVTLSVPIRCSKRILARTLNTYTLIHSKSSQRYGAEEMRSDHCWPGVDEANSYLYKYIHLTASI